MQSSSSAEQVESEAEKLCGIDDMLGRQASLSRKFQVRAGSEPRQSAMSILPYGSLDAASFPSIKNEFTGKILYTFP